MRFSKDQQVNRNTNKMQFSPIKAKKSQKIVRSSLRYIYVPQLFKTCNSFLK